MIIKESQMSQGFDGLNLLNEMSYLTEKESAYYPAMVPVLENSRIGAYTIALEDINEFCESNGIEDMGYAVAQICEASQIQPSDVVFTIKQQNVVLGEEMADLAAQIMQENIGVVAVPLSENHPFSILANVAIDASLNGDDSFLEAYANMDFDQFYVLVEANEQPEAEAPAEDAKEEQKQAEGIIAKAKAAATKGKNAIAGAISAVYNWIKTHAQSAGSAIIGKLKQVLNFLKSKLSRAKKEEAPAAEGPAQEAQPQA